jgi:hypothetical protein
MDDFLMEKQYMSESITNVKELSLLDQLRMQHGQFVQQKELAQNNLNQLAGAIFACEIMIQKHTIEMEKQPPAGDQGNGEADSEKKEQPTQE